MATDAMGGTLEEVDTIYTNPYTGELLHINGPYYVIDDVVFGEVGVDDRLLGNPNNQLWYIEDEAGDQMIGDFSGYFSAAGDDILLFASTTYILGDIYIASSWGNDIVWSNVGNDEIDAGSGDDIVHGGAGNDTIYGDSNNDDFYGDDE